MFRLASTKVQQHSLKNKNLENQAHLLAHGWKWKRGWLPELFILRPSCSTICIISVWNLETHVESVDSRASHPIGQSNTPIVFYPIRLSKTARCKLPLNSHFRLIFSCAHFKTKTVLLAILSWNYNYNVDLVQFNCCLFIWGKISLFSPREMMLIPHTDPECPLFYR